ncbi:hypothetical protein [Saccharopolyspora shandongensis]|uniref:hypothetical protein n=1 Tax=Saccharopolyspora shandongensis TaxID=418495 RepID=UPI0034093EE7
MLVYDEGELQRAVTLFQAAADTGAEAARMAPKNADQGLPPWGSDPLGKAFGGQYKEPADQLGAALDQLAGLFHGVSDQLNAITRQFNETEAGNIELVRRTAFDGRD